MDAMLNAFTLTVLEYRFGGMETRRPGMPITLSN
jgi:hypothetical protein